MVVAEIAIITPVDFMPRIERVIAMISNNAIETSGEKQMLKLADFFASSSPAAPGV